MQMRGRANLLALCLLFASCSNETTEVPSAKTTAENIILKLADHEPQVLWNSLPESYQVDANQLAREAIASIDEKVYEKILLILRKVQAILHEKKELFLESSSLGLSEQEKRDFGANWNISREILELLLETELGSFEEAKQLDLGKLLAEAGPEIMDLLAKVSKIREGDPWEKSFVEPLRSVKVESLEESHDAALLRVIGPDGEIEEQNWVKLKGKWIPQEVRDGWIENASKIRETIEASDEKRDQSNLEIAMILGMIDRVLDQLDQSSSQEEFEANLMNLLKLASLQSP